MNVVNKTTKCPVPAHVWAVEFTIASNRQIADKNNISTS